MSRHLLLALGLAGALAASACDAQPDAAPAASAAEAPDTTAGTPTVPQAVPLTASGAPQARSAEALDDSLQSAASVVRVDWVADQSAKLFGTAGGDPAMNGLYTYIGFFGSPADGWVVFKLGDVLEYTVLSSSAGRVDLDLHESTYDEASGQIGSRHRKVIVAWTVPAEGGSPAAITVTPAS